MESFKECNLLDDPRVMWTQKKGEMEKAQALVMAFTEGEGLFVS
jgi:hypothetical protein